MMEKLPRQENRESEPRQIMTYTQPAYVSELTEFVAQQKIADVIEKCQLLQPVCRNISESPHTRADQNYSAQTKAYASYSGKPPRLVVHEPFFTKLSPDRRTIALMEELVHAKIDQSGQLEFVYQARAKASLQDRDPVLSDSIDGLLAEPIEITTKKELLQLFPREQTDVFEWRLSNEIRNLIEYQRKNQAPDHKTRSDVILIDLLGRTFHNRSVSMILKQAGNNKLAKKYQDSIKDLQTFRRHYSAHWVQARPNARAIKDGILGVEKAKNYQEYINHCQQLIASL